MKKQLRNIVFGVINNLKSGAARVIKVVIKRKIIVGTLLVSLCILTLALVSLSKPKDQPVPQLPELTVNKPKAPNKQTLIISGKTDPGDTVFADGAPIPVKADGSFSLMLTGDQTASRIMRVVAVNKQGLQSVKEVDIIPPDLLYSDAADDTTITGPVPPNLGTGSSNDGNNTQKTISSSPATQIRKSLIANSNTSNNKPFTAYPPKPTVDNNTPPDLKIQAPTTTTDPHIVLVGTSTPGADVVINNALQYKVSLNGQFIAGINLTQKGPTIINITVIGKNGKHTTTSVTVDYQ